MLVHASGFYEKGNNIEISLLAPSMVLTNNAIFKTNKTSPNLSTFWEDHVACRTFNGQVPFVAICITWSGFVTLQSVSLDATLTVKNTTTLLILVILKIVLFWIAATDDHCFQCQNPVEVEASVAFLWKLLSCLTWLIHEERTLIVSAWCHVVPNKFPKCHCMGPRLLWCHHVPPPFVLNTNHLVALAKHQQEF